MSTAPLPDRLRATLALHGFLAMLAGLLGGMAYLFQILGYIEIFPVVPRIDMQVQGSGTAWHGAHLGPLVNGLLVIAVAAIGGLLRLGAGAQRALTVALLVTLWGNLVGYFISAIAGGRGLAFGGSAVNTLAYLSFLAAAAAVFVALGLVIAGLLAARR